ncbi:MAG: hypothetical protein ACJAZP_003035 [Psychromonas sp.]|jgi:hypothetical protein
MTSMLSGFLNYKKVSTQADFLLFKKYRKFIAALTLSQSL